MAATPVHVLAIDQGTTSTRAIVFDRDGLPRRHAQRELRQSIPHDGWVEHDLEDIWRDTASSAATALAEAGLTAPPICRHRHHQPARNHGALGPADRRAAAQRHRLAGPAHGGRSAAGSTATAPNRWWRERTGLLIDPYFSAHQAGLAARPRSRCAPAGGAGRAVLRHHRQLPAVPPDRRQGPRDRRQQRVAHAAVRHPQTGLGRRISCGCSTSRAPYCQT